MVRRKFRSEFKTEAVKLTTEQGVSVAQVAHDLDLAESVLQRWMRELAAGPMTAFPGHGQQTVDLAEIAALKKEVSELKATRDIRKKARDSSQESRHEVRLHREAPVYLAGELAVQCS